MAERMSFQRVVDHPILRLVETFAAGLAIVAVLVSVVLYWLELPDRRRNLVFSAWQTISSAEGTHVSGGRKEALELLVRNDEELVGVNLSNAIFRALDLSNTDLSFASLDAIRCSNCRLKNVSMRDTAIAGARFDNRSDFSEARFINNDLGNSFFIDSIFVGTTFLNVKGNAGTSFNGTNLQDSVITNSTLRQVIFDNADLSNGTLLESDIREATFQRATLNGYRVSFTNATGAQFRQAQGVNTIFNNNTILDGARFDGAKLTNSLFENVSLKGANFFGAQLHGSSFANCDLTDADFESADLTDALICGCKGLKLAGARVHPRTVSKTCNDG